MWWEALPSFAIVISTLFSPYIIVYAYNSLLLGNPYNRRLHNAEDCFYFLRDARVSGKRDPYRQIGLSDVDLGEMKNE